MTRLQIVLFFVVGFLSYSANGFEFQSAKRYFSNFIDRATNLVGNQKPIDPTLFIPENAEIFHPSKAWNPTFSCHEDGLFSYIEDCTLGVLCREGLMSVFTCTDVKHFNNVTKECDSFCSAHCDQGMACVCGWDSCETFTYLSTIEENPAKELTEESTNVLHSKRLHQPKSDFHCYKDGFFQDPTNCSLFIECLDGQANAYPCPSGFHFNQETELCDTPCNAQCDPNLSCTWRSRQITEEWSTEDYTTADSTESSKKVYTLKLKFVCVEDGMFPDPDDCSKFIHCYNGFAYKKSCPTGLHFSDDAKRCEYPCSAKCDPTIPCKWRSFKKTILNNVLEDTRCVNDGVYANSPDCDTFIWCENKKSIIMRCPEGLHFNEQTERCEEPCSARCDSSFAEKCGWEDGIELKNVKFLKQPIFDFTCVGNGLYENPHACENFIQCTGGNAYLINCPYGQHYNSATQTCTTPCEARCDPNYENYCQNEEKNLSSMQRQPGFDCATDGFHANPLECESFVQCYGGEAFVISCPVGFHYSSNRGICMTPCKAQCASNYEDFCKSKERDLTSMRRLEDFDCVSDGYHVNPLDCASFIQCFHGEAFVIACPPDLHYSPEKEICMTPCDAQCAPNYDIFCKSEDLSNNKRSQLPRKNTLKQPSVPDIACSPFDNWALSNPEECGSYVRCFNGQKHIIPCPDGLHFNPETQQCGPPCDARCDSSIATTCGWDKLSQYTTRSQDATFNYDMLSSTDSNSLVYDFTCLKDGVYKNPEDCSTYIQCSRGHSYIIQCPEGLHFNEEEKGCDAPCNAKCNASLACICDWPECAYHLEALEEIDCEAEPEVGPCMEKLPRYYYDLDSGRCRTFYYGGCKGNSNNFKTMDECEKECRSKLLGGFRCPAPDGMFGHYPDCTSFYHCKRGIPFLKKCPKGTAFDHKKSKCVTEYKATCVFECRDPDAVYPFEGDCYKYIDCVNGVSKVERCPSGKAFHPQEKDCVDKKQVSSCLW